MTLLHLFETIFYEFSPASIVFINFTAMNEIDIELELKKSNRLIQLLVEGYGRHGISTDMWKSKHLTVEWVVQHYNVEMEYFTN